MNANTNVADQCPHCENSENWEYKSESTLFGMPLLHVASGMDPVTGKTREARGIFAIGGKATGFIAFGGIAKGVFAFGGVAIGVVAFGGCALGLMSFGGAALGLIFATGGLAIGTVAAGGCAVGCYAIGGLAVGVYANGGLVFATHVLNNQGEWPSIMRMLNTLVPYLPFSYILWIFFVLLPLFITRWARAKAVSRNKAVHPSGG